MPDVQLRYPVFMFAAFGNSMVGNRDACAELIAATVAEFLDCNDYSGQPLSLKPSQIDVHMIPYRTELMYTHGGPVFLQIVGYDYPKRMKNMESRLTSIKNVLNDYLRELDVETEFVRNLGRGKITDLINVTFIPVQDGCFV